MKTYKQHCFVRIISRRRSGARTRGFSLTELLASLAVAGVLAALASPNLADMIADQRILARANTFVLALNAARSESGKRGAPVTIAAVDATDAADEWSSGWTIFVDDVTPNGAQDAGETTVRIGDALTSNTLDSTDDVSFVQYRPAGLLDVSPATRTFRLCDNRTGETGRLIAVGPTGRTTVTAVACP